MSNSVTGDLWGDPLATPYLRQIQPLRANSMLLKHGCKYHSSASGLLRNLSSRPQTQLSLQQFRVPAISRGLRQGNVTRKCRLFGAKSPRYHPPSSLKLSYRTRTRPGPRCPPRPGSGRGPAARLGSGKEVLAAPQPFHCHPRTPASQPPNNHPRHSNHPHPERLGRHPRRPLATTGRIQLIDHRAPFTAAPSIDPDTTQKVGILFAVL